MNGAATVSPLFVANICCCGHDYAVHNLAVTPNTCALCLTSGVGNLNQHAFTSADELSPRSAFPQGLPPRSVSPGGFGPVIYTTSSGIANVPGATSVNVASTAGMVAGMTFTVTGNSKWAQATYKILAVSGPGVLYIGAPGLINNIGNGSVVQAQGAAGSTQGGGLPPNGQRAG
jgi:hypothetical protein